MVTESASDPGPARVALAGRERVDATPEGVGTDL
ncbi:hypothetical protein FsymDg_4093 [Candidatus Protofrankia datiscae]|uniref:Uncharacterized protein n=1 Tax=Candidatus Protofrankia datiscae TaxID=2716812 RepID=F8AW41_9ACTN|nr:hypothetical protein FsymDg_4093 [Candidatus Protofrankia datiscae]